MELEKARKKKIKETHPDKVSNMSPEIRKFATEQMNKIEKIYKRLKVIIDD